MTDEELKDYLERVEDKLDATLGHIAVLNDEHEKMVAWREDMDRWRGAISSKLGVATLVGTIAAAASAASALNLDHWLVGLLSSP
jgi:hypothetical protein